jgi:hypothetical protein
LSRYRHDDNLAPFSKGRRVSQQKGSSAHMQVVERLREHGYASLFELGRVLFPMEFLGDDVVARQEVLGQLQSQCTFLVQAGVLSTAYSPVDGDLVYCIREVFQRNEQPVPPPSEPLAPAAVDASPAVFRRRGDADWRGHIAPTAGPEIYEDEDAAIPPAQVSYAVFFKLGTRLRPSCDSALRDLARVAAQARQVHVVGLEARNSSVAEMSGVLASQRAAVVVNRLVDCGIDRFRIEMSIRPWDEQPLPKDVYAVDPPTSLSAQARRVDISLLGD